MLLLRDVNWHFPSWAEESDVHDGRYTLLYEGRGQFELKFDATVVASREGRIDFDVALTQSNQNAYDGFDNGVLIRITHIDPHDPLRNIRVVMPPPADWRAR